MGHGHDEFEGGFGVRRPLRFLAHRLELNDTQVAALARILDELKTERAQAAVDGRRTLARVRRRRRRRQRSTRQRPGRRRPPGEERRTAPRRGHDGTAEIHAILTPDQRGRLAYMIRTGALSV